MNDEELYNACIHFCQAYTHFLLKKQDYDNYRLFRACDEYELEQRMDFERKRFTYAFDRLKKVVNEYD